MFKSTLRLISPWLLRAGLLLMFASGYADAAPAQAVRSPGPITATLFTEGNPAAQAKAAVQAFSSSDYRVRLGAVLGALASAGVPVVGPDGKPMPHTGDDPFGLPWVHVAGVALASPLNSLPLSDVVRSFDQPLARPRPASGLEAKQLVASLRLALTNGSASARFFANLIAETNRRLGGPELSAPGTSAEQIRIDAATMTVILGRFLRTYIFQFSAERKPVSWVPGLIPIRRMQFTLPPGATIGPLPIPPVPSPTSPPIDCSSDGMNGWGMWLGSKLFGGVPFGSIGGVEKEFSGIFSELLNRAAKAGEIGSGISNTVNRATRAGGYLASMLTLYNVMYLLMKTEASAVLKESEPLIRNKKRREGHGEAKKIVVTVKIAESPPWDKGMDVDIINCLSMMAVGTGNNTLFPKPGPVAGVEVEIEGGEGFARGLDESGTLVLFGPETFQRKRDTNKEGQATFGVMGRRQESDAGDSARPIKKRFSVFLSATPEPTEIHSLGRTFLDSVVCNLSGPAGCADAIADIVKGFHWRLGEHGFGLQDWSHGWVINEEYIDAVVSIHSTALSCESEYGPWTITTVEHFAVGMTFRRIDHVVLDANGKGKGTSTETGNYMVPEAGPCNTSLSDSTSSAQLVPNAEGYLLSITDTILRLHHHCSPPPNPKFDTLFTENPKIDYHIVPATSECK